MTIAATKEDLEKGLPSPTEELKLHLKSLEDRLFECEKMLNAIEASKEVALTFEEFNLYEQPLLYHATHGSCGFDIRANITKPITIACGEIVKIDTCLRIDMTKYKGLCAIVLPRSSSNNLGIANTIGLIDTDYLGNWFVKVKNTSFNEPLTIEPMERFCQVLFVQAVIPDLESGIVNSANSIRAEGGDGSTGKI